MTHCVVILNTVYESCGFFCLFAKKYEKWNAFETDLKKDRPLIFFTQSRASPSPIRN